MMEGKRYEIQCYVVPWFGHAIPMGKVAETIQVKMPDANIKVIGFEFMRGRIEKDFKGINFVGLYPEYVEEIQDQINNLPLKQIFIKVFSYFEDYLQHKRDLPHLIIADMNAIAPMNFAKKNGIPFIVNYPNSYGTLHSHFNFVSLNRSYNIEGFLINYSLPQTDAFWPFDEKIKAFRGYGRAIFHSFVGLDDPNIMPPNHTLIGLLPKRTDSEITPELREWMESWRQKGKENFLYVSFGSMVKLSHGFADNLAKMFVRLNIPIIWSLRAPKAQEIRDPLIFHRPWLPQMAILQRPEVRAYVTHCGWGSITEAILTKTPLLCIPVFFDQPLNADLVMRRHIGICIQEKTNFKGVGEYEIDISEQRLKQGVAEILEDESYYRCIERIDRMNTLQNSSQIIYKIVREALQFGNGHLINPLYEQATIKTGSALSTILRKDYLPQGAP